ncbi:MAG TPA: hypothetical protein VD833_21950 [Vicinamibacterales bacterium]|nr:hypothetical protein [Vicinamibacterales bacterium]
MNSSESDVVLAQRYTYATVALVIGFLSFVNFLGFEKSILAIVLGLKALSHNPPPALPARRSWAKVGIAMGTAQVLLVAGILLWNLDRIPEVIDALRALSDGR